MVIFLKIIAHRGNDGIYKENSFEAIINSLNKSYVDGVEFDIRLTKDGKFVLCHDPFYMGRIIKDTSSDLLKKLGLNTLEEILNSINSDKILLIDVKEEGKDILKLSYLLYSVLIKYDLNYYICSFNYEFINRFHKYGVKSGLIMGSKINVKYIDNDFDFNLISYKFKGMIPHKETFIWTVNKTDQIKSSYNNIITDDAKKIYDFVNRKKL